MNIFATWKKVWDAHPFLLSSYEANFMFGLVFPISTRRTAAIIRPIIILCNYFQAGFHLLYEEPAYYILVS